MQSAGLRRHHVTIQRPDTTLDANGQVVPTWSTLHTDVPASITDTAGGETVRGKQMQAGVDALIEFVYLAGIDPKDRITFGSRTFNVERIDDTDLRMTRCYCSELR